MWASSIKSLSPIAASAKQLVLLPGAAAHHQDLFDGGLRTLSAESLSINPSIVVDVIELQEFRGLLIAACTPASKVFNGSVAPELPAHSGAGCIPPSHAGMIPGLNLFDKV